MPQLSDLVEKKKFVKKNFRPWDLSGTGTIDNPENIQNEIAPAPIEVEAVISQPTIQENIQKIKIPTIEKHEKLIEKKTGNNEVTTRQQPGNITGNNEVTTRQQPDNNEVTKKGITGNNGVTTRQQPGNVTGNITGNKNDIIYLTHAIKKLIGIQKKVFHYVINVCMSRGTLDTGNIFSNDLAEAANCSIGSAKTSLIRLVEKQLLLRLEGKACKGGHTVLGITKEIQAATLQAQQDSFNPFKTSVTGNITGNITGNNRSYSSSKDINITTTALPEDWEKIDFSLLENIGFNRTKLLQLHDKQLNSPEVIQESIYHFAYGLEHSPKVMAYTEPLNVLIGVLRKGQMWTEPSYVSPKDLALRQLLEEKRKKKEQQDAMIKELIELEFPEWKRKLTEDEIKEIVPADVMKTKLSGAIHSSLRTYYIDNIAMKQFFEANEI